MNDIKDTKVKMGEVRFSYVNVFKPQPNDDGVDKYSVSVIIPKSAKKTIAEIERAVKNARVAGADKIGKGNVKLPLRDGDEDKPEDEAYADSYFFSATSTRRPGLVDIKKQPITDPEEFYSGCYGYVSINFYAFKKKGNKGVAAGLNNILRTRKGDYLGGSVSADVDFEDLELDESEFQDEFSDIPL